MQRRLASLACVVLLAALVSAFTACVYPAEGRKPNVAVETSRWDDPSWISERDKVLAADADCQELWNVLWPWAKKGNLQARHGILGHLIYFGLGIPGSSEDFEARKRDMVIMAVHSLGYEDSYPGTEMTQQIPLDWLRGIRSPAIKNFFACVEHHPSQECAKIAVEEEIVPSFEEYARKVDEDITAGKKAQCRDVHKNF